jgi:hypothetical protein
MLECLEDRRLLTAQPLAEAGQPNNYDQYLLEMINRGRSDPVAEAARYGIGLNDGLSSGTISTQPKQPLTFAPALIDAARGHSEWMLANNKFSHTGEDGSSPGTRMSAAGYAFVSPWTWGENISWRGTVGTVNATDYVEMIAEGLFKSAGHRMNQMKPEFRESGVGVVQGNFASGGMTWNALMATEKFARSGNTVFMTGVVYDDALVRADQFYTPGEGLGGVTIEAIRTSDSQVFSTQTWASGGYTLALAGGTYTIVAKGGSLNAPIARGGVVIGTENVKVDFTPSDPSTVDPPPTPEPPPPVPDPVSVAIAANPQIVTQSDPVTLTATVTGETTARVLFYRDSNGNGAWDSGDQLLGTDQEGSNGWSATVATTAWPVGQQRLFARAQDSVGTWSNVAAVNVSVNAAVPATGSGSGNVTVTVSRGDLVITGDSLANSVQVRPGSAPGQWVVTGVGNTTINRSPQSATLTGVTRDVVIRMQSGDDILNVEDVAVPRNLRVEMGAGNTEAVFESIVVGGNAAFYHGSGQRNQLTVTASQVKGKVNLRGGTGSDQVIFSRTTVDNDLIANLSGGADLLEVRSATIGRNLSVQTGSRAGQEAKIWIGYGKDQVDEDVLTTIAQDAIVRGGAGSERIDIQGMAASRDLTVDTGGGDDVLDLLASSSGRNAQIKLTDGSNLAWIDDVIAGTRFTLSGGRSQDMVLVGSRSDVGVRAGSGVVNLGAGNDTLLICESTFGQLQVNTTSGNNDVYLERNKVTLRTQLRGGKGVDRLTKDLSLNVQLASLSVTNFLYDLPQWDGVLSSDTSDIVPPPTPEPPPPPPVPDPVSVAIAANPQIVTQSDPVTLTATVTGGTAARVLFYRDSNGNGAWDSGDQLLGTDQEGSNGWSTTVATTAWPVGQQRLFARAQDSAGTWSNVAAVNVSVNAAVPATGSGSGNVTVTVSRGDLVITGDSLANSVQVRPGSAPGQWVVTGVGNTIINRSPQSATLTGVTRDVVIRMQSGDDILNVEDVAVPRNLRVEMGAGNTEAVFESIEVGGNAAFYHGSGQRNQLTVTASQVKGKVNLRGGTGSDQVIFSRTTVDNDLIANLSGGADLLEVRSATIGRNLNVQTGSRAGQEAKIWIGYGKDQVDEDVLTTIAQDAIVRGGAGSERIDIQGMAASRDLKVDTGAGDDVLDLLASSSGRNAQIKLTDGSNLAWIDDVIVGTRFTLSGGRSQDTVLVGSRSDVGVRAGSGVVNLGAGNDTLLIRESTFGQLQVNTTSGNNDVYLECNAVTLKTQLRGGKGVDRLTKDLSLNDQLAGLSVTNFVYELPKWDDLPS